MITIALANQKGGVGKTTSAVNISAALARSGFRVLLVDLDAQAGATQNCLDSFGQEGSVVYDVILNKKPISSVLVPFEGGFDLLPSDLSLAGLDKELVGKPNPDGRLAMALEQIDDRYDFAFIDCPGWLGAATLNAFTAANHVIIPIDCKAQSLETVNKLHNEIREVAAAWRRSIGTFGLPTFYEARLNLSREILDAIRGRFESATLSPVNKNTKLAEAYYHRRTIFDYDPTSSGAVDYLRVAKEIASATFEEGTRAGRSSRKAKD